MKDAVLDSLAADFNIAQFVSFDPELTQRFAWLRGWPRNARFVSPRDAAVRLLKASGDGSVNIRSFAPGADKSREFLYGLKDADGVVHELARLAAGGAFTIVNETIDVKDGGVSGVVFGDLIEFAPDDTPRCVEKAGTAAFPRADGLKLLSHVYGTTLPVERRAAAERIEFSLHPLAQGVRQEHTIIWELEETGEAPVGRLAAWPNRFSRFLGDKAYGLLVADLAGLRVPRTTVFSRRVAPFSFGVPTGSCEPWIRTCPVEQVPGKFTTRRGWLDPFELMNREDPAGTMLASVLHQEGVPAIAAGALLTGADRRAVIEGVFGSGEKFMVGARAPESLPEDVRRRVQLVYDLAVDRLGPVRFEWVFDGTDVWIVQMHIGAVASTADTIFPGSARHFRRFDVALGLEALRRLVDEVSGTGDGIELAGDVGVTSHFGDVLRRARTPSRLVRTSVPKQMFVT